MTKATITKLFVGGMIAVIAEIVLGFAALLWAYLAGVFVLDGPDVVGIAAVSGAWAAFGVMAVGVIAMTAGAMAGLVAWIGALLNTAQLDDKVWFVVLLVLGLLSFGFVAMIAYVIAGPDGTSRAARPASRPTETLA